MKHSEAASRRPAHADNRWMICKDAHGSARRREWGGRMDGEDLQSIAMRFPWKPGDWFWLKTEATPILRNTDRRAHPWMVLEWDHSQPQVILRSTPKRGTRLRHPAHAHEGPCRLRKDSFIKKVKISVRRNDLDLDSYSCREPDPQRIIDWFQLRAEGNRS